MFDVIPFYGSIINLSREETYLLMIGLLEVAMIAIPTIYILLSILSGKIFRKAGLPAWKAWVPYVREWTFLELGGYNGAFSLLSLAVFAPFAGRAAAIIEFVFLCMAANEISKKLQKPDSSILFSLAPITLGITAAIWFFKMAQTENEWNDSLGKESLAKDTILGYQVIEERQEEKPYSEKVVEITNDKK